MEIDGDWVVCPLTDPEPLRQALALIQGTNADALARLEPVTPPLVEHRGVFGRTRQKPVGWGATVVHWSDEDGVGEFDVKLDVPAGAGVQAAAALPAGVTVSPSGDDALAVRLDETLSPAAAAAGLAFVVGAVFGEIPGGWQVRVVDNTFSLGD